jgi:hypothetical protein
MYLFQSDSPSLAIILTAKARRYIPDTFVQARGSLKYRQWNVALVGLAFGTWQSVLSVSSVGPRTSVGPRWPVFWDIASCSLVQVDWGLRGAYCLHYQGALMTESEREACGIISSGHHSARELFRSWTRTRQAEIRDVSTESPPRPVSLIVYDHAPDSLYWVEKALSAAKVLACCSVEWWDVYTWRIGQDGKRSWPILRHFSASSRKADGKNKNLSQDSQ